MALAERLNRETLVRNAYANKVKAHIAEVNERESEREGERERRARVGRTLGAELIKECKKMSAHHINPNAVRWYIDGGADVNHHDEHRLTPLFYASRASAKLVQGLMLVRGCDFSDLSGGAIKLGYSGERGVQQPQNNPKMDPALQDRGFVVSDCLMDKVGDMDRHEMHVCAESRDACAGADTRRVWWR